MLWHRFILDTVIYLPLLECPAYAASLGDVHFPISCRPEAQHTFEAGVALLHSFAFREAENAFRGVERIDPKCAIAAWGVVLLQRSERAAKRSFKGMGGASTVVFREGRHRAEKMYVNAVRAMYQDYATPPKAERWAAYLWLFSSRCLRRRREIRNAMLGYRDLPDLLNHKVLNQWSPLLSG